MCSGTSSTLVFFDAITATGGAGVEGLALVSGVVEAVVGDAPGSDVLVADGLVAEGAGVTSGLCIRM